MIIAQYGQRFPFVKFIDKNSGYTIEELSKIGGALAFVECHRESGRFQSK